MDIGSPDRRFPCNCWSYDSRLCLREPCKYRLWLDQRLCGHQMRGSRRRRVRPRAELRRAGLWSSLLVDSFGKNQDRKAMLIYIPAAASCVSEDPLNTGYLIWHRCRPSIWDVHVCRSLHIMVPAWRRRDCLFQG